MSTAFYASFALRLYGAAAGFALTLALGRVLGPEGFGAYAYAMGWVNVALLATTFGFHHFCVRALPPMLLTGRHDAARGLVLAATGLTAAAALALTLAAPGLVAALHLSPDPRMAEALATGAFLLLPLTLNQLRAGVLRGLGRPVAAQAPEQVLQPTLLLALLGGAAALGAGLNAQGALLLSAAAAMAALVFGAAPAIAALRALPQARPSFALRGWLAEAGKSSVLFAAGVIMSATDVMMLGALSSAEQTGLYGVAARFFMLMQLPALAASAAMSHEAALLHAAGNRAALSTLVRGTAGRTVLAALGLAALCTPIALRPDLVFGAGFAAATAPMLILIWTRAGEAVFGHPGSVIANAGGTGRAGLIVLAGAVLNGALNFVLIPQFGATGAACATAAAYLALTAVLAHAVWRQLGVACLPGGRAPFRKERT